MRSFAILSSIIVIAAGCGSDRGNGISYPPTEAGTVTLSLASSEPMTAAGDTREVTARVTDARGAVNPVPQVVWTSSAPTVATVTGTASVATITAVGDGTATITAASGGAAASVDVTVRRTLVSIELVAQDTVVVEGFTTQLIVIGRDPRQQPIAELPDVRFASSNAFSVAVSPNGLVTALFSSVRPFSSTITATVTVNGATFTATRRIDVASAAPAVFDVSALLTPEEVRPEPANSAGAGIIYFERTGDRVQYKLLWSLLSGPALAAHIHGPDRTGADSADVLVDLPLGVQTNTNGTLIGSFSATDIRARAGESPITLDSLVTLLSIPEQAYVDVHTGPFRDGEIRGPTFPRR
jgi:hypothetical protein